MVYGQSQDWVPHYTTVQMGECLSVYHLLPQHGILLRVVATATLAVSAVSVATASIGLPLLTATTRAAWTSPTMAVSICLANTVARTATQSVVSKNNS